MLNKTNSLNKEIPSQRFPRLKLVTKFFWQAFIYLITTHKKTFANTKPSPQPQIDPGIFYAFDHDSLSSAHHGLLFEPAFIHLQWQNTTACYFKAARTDIYWGDFIATAGSQKNTAAAIQEALNHAIKHHRNFALIDVNEDTVKMIEQHQIPLLKSYLGEEWITDIQQFDMHGKKSRAFRKALVLAKRYHFHLEEIPKQEDHAVEAENMAIINDLILRFSRRKHLKFPRLGAASVTRHLIDESIYRRIFKISDAQNNLLAIITLCKLGKNTYFLEHGASYKHYHFLFDWCLPQVLLQLKEEGAKYFSWGRIAHLFSEEEVRNNPEAWLLQKFYRLSGLEKFIVNTMKFKKDFIPIIKVNKWFFYNDFNAEILLDIANMVGVKHF